MHHTSSSLPSEWHRFYTQHVQPHLQLPPQLQHDCATHEAIDADEVLAACLPRVPKSDQHAHLNGSISMELLAHLEKIRGDEDHYFQKKLRKLRRNTTMSNNNNNNDDVDEDDELPSSPQTRMQSAFNTFDRIYRIMTCLSFTRLAVQDVLLHSVEESICFLELRTSLRSGMSSDVRGDDVVSTSDYLDAIEETAEHLLAGGVVDLNAGTLIPIPTTTTSSSSLAPPPPEWLEMYSRVYGTQAAQRLVRQRVRERIAHHVHVRLLVSVNRGAAVEDGAAAVHVARRLQAKQVQRFHARCVGLLQQQTSSSSSSSPTMMLADVVRRTLRKMCWVTGADFSGNCYKGVWQDFAVILDELRSSSSSSSSSRAAHDDGDVAPRMPTTLALTLHGGEKDDAQELAMMMKLHPRRWGHLVFTTPELLTQILRQHDGVELCLMSNIITGGLGTIEEHHLAEIMRTWSTLTSSSSSLASIQDILLTRCGEGDEEVGGGYAASEQLRLARRFQRLPSHTNTHEKKCDGDEMARLMKLAIPSISFHTDDRGVFDVSLSEELSRLWRHTAFVGPRGGAFACAGGDDDDVGVVVTALHNFLAVVWAVERLSLLHLFELPWPAMLLTAHLIHSSSSSSCVDEWISVLPQLPGQWRSWDVFASFCVELSTSSTSAHDGATWMEELSRWETQLLTADFDRLSSSIHDSC